MDFTALTSLFLNIRKLFETGKKEKPSSENDERKQGMNNAGTSSNMIQAGDNATVIVGGEVPFKEQDNALYYRNSEGEFVPVSTGYRFWSGTQAEYDSISVKRDDTLYLVSANDR